MILISHRGNVDNIQPKRENTKEYILEAIDRGFYVEIDIWMKNGSLFLGHDSPENEVSVDWLNKFSDKLFIHSKNYSAFCYFMYENAIPIPTFYHTIEDHVVIGNTKLVWSHNLEECNERSVIPLLDKESIKQIDRYPNVYGVCSDFVGVL